MNMSIDNIEPIQLEKEYLDEFRQESIPPQIKALAEAILDQALLDIVNNDGREAALYWIEIDNFDYLFSFRNICTMLGMNPYVIRRAMRKEGKTLLKKGFPL
ncbi:MAG: hypothetical protein K6U11_05290 [bacterium]|nr:hypothetical protein [bacterium]